MRVSLLGSRNPDLDPDMAKEGAVTISQAGNTVEPVWPLKGPIRLHRPGGKG